MLLEILNYFLEILFIKTMQKNFFKSMYKYMTPKNVLFPQYHLDF